MQKNICLEVFDLSLSIVEQPPPFFRLCKTANEYWNKRKQLTVDKGETIKSTVSKTDTVGISILRNVSIVAEPGNGKVPHSP